MQQKNPLASRFAPSPNYNERKNGIKPDMVLLHYTGMDNSFSAVERLCNPCAQVSAHYIVFENGDIWQLVNEEHRAWHAGIGQWQGVSDINSHSIGIEIANRGHNYPERDASPPPYPDSQINAVIALAKDITSRWGIAQNRILGHSDIAPERKTDPGEIFPWERLFRAEIGIWVPPAPLVEGVSFNVGDKGLAVTRIQTILHNIGYAIVVTNQLDLQTQSVLSAFQRHFRPEKIDGIADPSTIQTMNELVHFFKDDKI